MNREKPTKTCWRVVADRFNHPTLPNASVWSRQRGDGSGWDYWLGVGRVAEKGPGGAGLAYTHRSESDVMRDFYAGVDPVQIMEVN